MMCDLILAHPLRIAPMSAAAIDQAARLEEASLAHMPQVQIPVDHCLHAGLYQRTVKVPAGIVITGALIRIATLLIVSGDCIVHVEGGPIELHGHHVLRAEAGRKQVFVALTDTYLTMVFPTSAATVEEAEREFTEEADKLQSRQGT